MIYQYINYKCLPLSRETNYNKSKLKAFKVKLLMNKLLTLLNLHRCNPKKHKIIKNLYKKIWVKSQEEVASKQNLNNNITETTLPQNIRTSIHDTKEYKFNTWLQSFIQYNASPFTISSID